MPAPIDVTLDAHFTCMDAFGDDEGNALFREQFNNGPPATEARFFLSGGADTGATLGANDEGGIDPQGQPDGYAVLNIGSSGAEWLNAYAANGSQTASLQLVQSFQALGTWVASSIPGDIYVAKVTYGNSPASTLQRYDSHLAPRGAALNLDGEAVALIGVSRSGDVLVLFTAQQGQGELGQWYSSDLQPLTAPFAANVSGDGTGMPWRKLVMLADGSLAFRADASHYAAVFPDAKAEMNAVPAWLAAHGSSDLFPIRGFTGYAAIPPGPGCSGTVEVVTADGTSCGCLDTHDSVEKDVISRVTLGRDGTLFVPVKNTNACEFHWYPALLK